MKESKADLLLHPVRIKIVQTLVNGRKLTVQQIGEKLPEIPQATLYRHLKKLLEADLIEVAEENRVRGTIEKVYTLPSQPGTVTAEEFMTATAEEHMNYFMKFMATVLSDFESYVSDDSFDFVKDGAGYRQATFYATDEEFQELVETIGHKLMKLLENEAGENRRRRTLSTIVTTQRIDKKRDE
ncbi:DNA-binding transcriptional ArsR family regulator [Bacillus ectoiniformans]|uniref:helix-turn-helix domain-containing protein n=1 Tax=Bacillus ectoiniformans TaxID=1494429 RepID=UPI00195701A7|nr:helix-turn-helix domain-containing protein [Bacillus ectoiniformans]MBM7648208.1 DNA-binding transcriptional ArsR family regulator [Bacillus ectoiniformans]